MTADATELAPGLFTLRVCSALEANAYTDRALRQRWLPATINADRTVDRAVRDAEVIDEQAAREFTEAMRARLFAATRALAAAIVPGSVLAELQTVRYASGGRYVEHRDTPARAATPRALSLVWYLNDDFSGGETTFLELPVRVRPERGIAIAFDPLLLHRAEPVLAGTKLAITAWYHDLTRV